MILSSNEKNLNTYTSHSIKKIHSFILEILFVLILDNIFAYIFIFNSSKPISAVPTLRNYMGGYLYITAEYPRSKERIQNVSNVLRYFDESGMLPVALSDVTEWSGFRTVLSKQSDMDKYLNIVPINSDRKKLEVAMWLRRNNSLTHFLNNTTAAWALLFDDDCDFAPQNYFRMIDELDRKYVSENESIIFGQKVTFPWSKAGAIIGGAGFIVSRKFAEHFVNNFEHEMTTMNLPDDLHMTCMAEKYGNIPDSYYGKYTTKTMEHNDVRALIEKRYEQFPYCSDIDDIVPEYYDAHPKLNEIFSFHKLEELKGARWENLANEMPENLIIYRRWKHLYPYICRDIDVEFKNISQKMRGKDTEYKWGSQ